MAYVKQVCAAVFIFFTVLILQTNLFAQSIGYHNILLGSKYHRIKEILKYYDYNFKETQIGVIKVVTYNDSQSQGMMVFDYFDRLYTVIVTIPVTDEQYVQLQQHLQRKYGEFTGNNNILRCTIGIYSISLYRNQAAKTATVEYSHTIPLFFPKEPMEKNPFSKF